MWYQMATVKSIKGYRMVKLDIVISKEIESKEIYAKAILEFVKSNFQKLQNSIFNDSYIPKKIFA